MTKQFCDKCKNEIKSKKVHIIYTHKYNGILSDKFELCEECCNKIINYIKEEEK